MSAVESPFLFNDKEKAIVLHFANQLKCVPIFETQRISDMLSKLRLHTPELNRWKEEVMEAVMDWDYQKLEMLFDHSY